MAAFDRAMDPAYGTAVPVRDGVRRLTVNNPGPFTFHGTNSWIIGHGPYAVVDPGPDDKAHLHSLLAATGGRIAEIFVTHTHRDHSPGAATLAQITGARILGCGPHAFARPLEGGETDPLDASADHDFAAGTVLADGETVTTAAGLVRALATPGHTANHLAFVFEEAGVIACGDHVMSWSTSIVAPPEGSMAAYMQSLDRIEREAATFYLPGHGNAIADGPQMVRQLRAHRLAREAAVAAALAAGPLTVAGIVARVYLDTPAALHAAAGLSVLAQLEWMQHKGTVTRSGDMGGAAVFALAG